MSVKHNVKIITVTVPLEAYAKRINSTPALRRMFQNDLTVGDNIIHCNHAQYANITRMSNTLYSIIEN